MTINNEVGREPNEVEKLAKQVVELKQMLESLKETAAPLEEEKARHKQDVKFYEDLAKQARDQANAVEIAMFDIKKQVRAAEKEAEQAERKLQQALKVQQSEAEFIKVQQEYMDLVANAPWFSSAKKHQYDAAAKMAFEGSVILADTMGLGKSLTALAACDMAQAKKILIVVPIAVQDPFISEIKRWAPHRQNVLPVGAMPKAQRNFALDIAKDLPECVVVINYEAWVRDKQLLQDLIAVGFDTVILDEAHNIKELDTSKYKGVKTIIDGLSVYDQVEVEKQYYNGEYYTAIENKRVLPRVYPMTGTPILNKPQELYTLLHLVDPTGFRNVNNFLNDYCQMGYNGKWEFRPGGLAKLSQKIANKFIRRTKETAGIDLPAKTIQVHHITLDPDTHPKQYDAAQQFNERAMYIIDEAEGKFIAATMILELILRKRQLMTWPAGIKIKDSDGNVVLQVDVEESVKLDYIIRPNGPQHSYDDAEGLLPEVVSNEKVVIFSQFVAPLDEGVRRCDLAGIKAAKLDGSVPHAERTKIIENFQNTPVGEGGYDVLFCNYKAMGVGVTLHAASQMIILDEEWNPGKNEQAYDRIHRIGQDKPVTIHILRVEQSVDGWMAGLIQQKADMISGFNAEVNIQQEMIEALRDGLF